MNKRGIFESILNYITDDVVEEDGKVTQLQETSKPTTDFITANVEEFKSAPKRMFMFTARKYAEAENEEIEGRQRFFYNEQGKPEVDERVSNNKLIHTKFINLINQKVGYILGKPFSINTNKNDKLKKFLGDLFNNKMLQRIKRLAREAIIDGIAWLQVYYDEKGKLQWKRIPGDEVAPFWVDNDHTELEGVIRFYPLTIIKNDGTKETIEKREYHTKDGSWYWILDKDGMREDDERNGQQGHFSISAPMLDKEGKAVVDDEGNASDTIMQAVWDRVPFIPLKYNVAELSLLKFFKSLIDDYDMRTSDVANLVEDIPDAVKVIKGYEGSDPVEVLRNLNVFRVAMVDAEGGLDSQEMKIDTTALENHLTRLDKDIYEAGNGVNLKDDNLGNASGVALKYKYSGLDMDMDDFGVELTSALQQLAWFYVLDEIMNQTGYGLSEVDMDADIDFIFNTDMIINDGEVITNLKNSVGIISNETIRANHPFVTDAEEEKQRLLAEETENLERIKKYQDAQYNFPGQEGNEDGNDPNKAKANEDEPPKE